MSAAEPQFLPVNAAWTPARCAALLEGLSPEQELQFYAADHASPSDPGAYIRVQRQGAEVWLRKAANHGWSTDWQRIPLKDLQGELYRNRHAQPFGVQLSAFRVQATEGEK
ncbi:hypothetical protein MF271_10070 [Deinococcus sp. KNUC1210]|uniref:hypothetical protein n=1 Tax=Deinococcus sp. KNUC1210 TaxID=2917691 RepID=UPI001EEF9D23|nr:hypothetical protein [Deinococcus sp. KNUC1210]ULH14387.1 hypothetical protein MF271_10070 [Deinococcus sp. KNUC1210]